MNIAKLTFLTYLVLILITGCGKSKEAPCNLAANISVSGVSDCLNAKVTFFKKNGTAGESIGIQFGKSAGQLFITVQTSKRPINPGIYQRYNHAIDDGSNFTRNNQTFLKSVDVEITKMDRTNKLISGNFTAEAESGSYGGLHHMDKFSGTFTDVSFP